VAAFHCANLGLRAGESFVRLANESMLQRRAHGHVLLCYDVRSEERAPARRGSRNRDAYGWGIRLQEICGCLGGRIIDIAIERLLQGGPIVGIGRSRVRAACFYLARVVETQLRYEGSCLLRPAEIATKLWHRRLRVFKPDGKTTEKAIVSVKGGENVNVAMIRDMGHVVERDKAKVGIFITLAEATGPKDRSCEGGIL
jgi:hypothetical protein